ncbi:uncharacterized protein N7459_007068 [Penicillium hispanicum]|uniref:uncharacterized protein n=1 Tax=Penicillium hispanicum TaxID=1080232 RepID=UPI002541D885|nr:uncharacterized protein N7459_007068 [Penicillium hispanicum]KAJ5578104.1 hypothetical protein N7459_007068 [Penicillium hispanicum]
MTASNAGGGLCFWFSLSKSPASVDSTWATSHGEIIATHRDRQSEEQQKASLVRGTGFASQGDAGYSLDTQIPDTSSSILTSPPLFTANAIWALAPHQGALETPASPEVVKSEGACLRPQIAARRMMYPIDSPEIRGMEDGEGEAIGGVERRVEK